MSFGIDKNFFIEITNIWTYFTIANFFNLFEKISFFIKVKEIFHSKFFTNCLLIFASKTKKNYVSDENASS
jgi:hypothetical protein